MSLGNVRETVQSAGSVEFSDECEKFQVNGHSAGLWDLLVNVKMAGRHLNLLEQCNFPVESGKFLRIVRILSN